MIITCACTSQDRTCLSSLVWFLASAPGTWSAYTATFPDDCSVGVFPAECSAPAAVAPALAILLLLLYWGKGHANPVAAHSQRANTSNRLWSTRWKVTTNAVSTMMQGIATCIHCRTVAKLWQACTWMLSTPPIPTSLCCVHTAVQLMLQDCLHMLVAAASVAAALAADSSTCCCCCCSCCCWWWWWCCWQKALCAGQCAAWHAIEQYLHNKQQ
jgi:hypothetical protein